MVFPALETADPEQQFIFPLNTQGKVVMGGGH